MSFFADLLGNAAIAGGKHLQGEIDEGRHMARLDHAAELASARDRTIKELALEFANKAREDQVNRTDTETGRLADEQVSAKRGLIHSGISNKETWTPAQQEAVDQSLAMDKTAAINSTDTRIQAGRNLGYVSDMDAARYDQTTAAATRQGERDKVGDAKDARDFAQREATLAQGAGERKLRLESLQMDVAQKKEASNLLTKYENATDPTVKAALRESLVMRGIIKQGDKDYDTQKVTTDVTDKDGNTTKTERTERVPRVSKEGAPTPEPSQAQIDLLLKNPKKRAGFDAVYGAGMSEKYLPKGGGAKSAPMTADNIRIGKDLGIQQPWFGPKRRVYEVTTPDGGTKEMGTDELRELGVQMPSLNGQLYYDPNYNKK